MLHRTWDDERGFSIVIVAAGLMAFLAATTLAIDVGMFMTARAQAQNAADAGALAGATALVLDSYTDRSSSGPAVQNALEAASANQVMSRAVSVTPADVTFPNDPQGRANWVRVQVFRSTMRGNPLATLMGAMFGVRRVNIAATATAEAAPANAMTCVKPFMIPDKWVERQTPPWSPDATFETLDRHGNPLPNPDVYIPADKTGYTGYNALRDQGTPLVIRAGTGNNIMPTMYFSWKMTGEDIGADYYRQNIAGCNATIVHWGDPMIQEPGDMSGPTMQGIDELIAKDPNAYWDTATNEVHTSLHPTPRIFPIPLYDPAMYAAAKQNGRTADFKVANWLGFFVERRSGNQVYGRITPIVGVIDAGAGAAPDNVFPRAIRLVQ